MNENRARRPVGLPRTHSQLADNPEGIDPFPLRFLEPSQRNEFEPVKNVSNLLTLDDNRISTTIIIFKISCDTSHGNSDNLSKR